MAIRVARTLEVMADVYRLPMDGGPRSARFAAYVARMGEGHLVSGYNPGTSKDVAATVESLLAVGAEGLCQEACDEVAGLFGATDDLVAAITVATPGLWTHRLATEVNHRLTHRCGTFGDTSWQVLLWTGEDTSPAAVVREAGAQAVRMLWRQRRGPPATAAEAAALEGLAYAVTDVAGAASQLVADALEVVGPDPHLGTMAGLLYGDLVASELGWTPLGLGELEGYRHFIHTAREAMAERGPCELLGWVRAAG